MREEGKHTHTYYLTQHPGSIMIRREAPQLRQSSSEGRLLKLAERSLQEDYGKYGKYGYLCKSLKRKVGPKKKEYNKTR